jgi:hypothetical protein
LAEDLLRAGEELLDPRDVRDLDVFDEPRARAWGFREPWARFAEARVLA